MRLALKLSLLLLVASCFTPGQDRREKLFIESVVVHRGSGKCVKWSHGPLYCWGQYAGLPATVYSNGPYPTRPVLVTLEGFNTADIVQMAATEHTLCARLINGGLQCWGGKDAGRGNNEYYQLGRGIIRLPPPAGRSYTPVPGPVVRLGDMGTLTGVTSIAAGNGTFCAVFGDQGEVACWGGSSTHYRLGVGPGSVPAVPGASPNEGSPTPLAVEAADRPMGSQETLRGAARLISGWVVLMRDATLVTWRSGFFPVRGHYLGRGNTSDRSSAPPGRVRTPSGDGFLSDVRTASAGKRHTCAALGEATTVYCWGENIKGEVGNGSTRSASRPVKVVPPAKAASLGRVLGIITPEDRTCTINAQLEVFCWGSNSNPADDIYRLGNTNNLLRPTRVFHNARVVAIHGDKDGLCFNYVGNLKCVGNNMPRSTGTTNNLGIGIAGGLTEAELGFGNGDKIYGNDPTETLENAPFLEFPGVPE